MRQQYETSENLAAEKHTISEFCKEMIVSAYKNPTPYYQIDYSITDQEDARVHAVAEVKRRFHNFGDFGTLIIALNKFKSGVEYKQLCGLDFYIIIEFNNGIWFYKYEQGDVFPVVFGGRTTNTRDADDIGPVIHIPISRFLRLKKED